MSRDNKTTSGKDPARTLRRAKGHATDPSGEAVSPSSLLTDCDMPGIRGELASADVQVQDICLLEGSLATFSQPAAIYGLNSPGATASEAILRERTRELMAALRRKAEYLDEHSRCVGMLSTMLALDLGLPQERAADFEWVGGLHDAGKLAVSGKVLRKPGKLSPEEYEEIKAHPEHSETLIAPLARLMGCDWAPPAVRHHHERIDGMGYPDSLAGEDIPLEARIIAVCDAYDAMASRRPYQGSLAESTIRENLAAAGGGHLDQSIVAVFLDKLSYYRERIYASA